MSTTPPATPTGPNATSDDPKSTDQALYRSVGFRDVEVFDGSEAAVAGLESLTQYLELGLS